MGYDAETTEREITKEKFGWKVAMISIVAFIVIGSLIWLNAGR